MAAPRKGGQLKGSDLSVAALENEAVDRIFTKRTLGDPHLWVHDLLFGSYLVADRFRLRHPALNGCRG
jgi:hypothetical protein